tara:strand:+ start:228 stop:1139 length:912 start_codon:yes stop_codon:yes gene_type:complete
LSISKKISEHGIFKKRPMLFMHLGSAGSNFKVWSDVSHNSILVSIDGNKSSLVNKKVFKKYISDSSIISYKNGKSIFYETDDPDCSSLLEPDEIYFKNWYFSHRFKVKKKRLVKTISINDFLKKRKIEYIDWFIIDVQGLDLKIIKSLKSKIRNNISIIDIEPGFFSFYKKADKISDVFKFLSKTFEFNDMKFGYNFKVNNKNISSYEKKILFSFNNPTKVYSNVVFLNKSLDLRSALLKVFYLVKNDKLFEAREILKKCYKKDRHLDEIYNKIDSKIKYKKIKFLLYTPIILFKKLFKYNVN